MKPAALALLPPENIEVILANGFRPLGTFAGTVFVIEPLHPVHSPLDYQAWHEESFAELITLFGEAWNWPRAQMTEADNRSDLDTKHYAHFLRQQDFAYAVLSSDHSRILGSLYINPGNFDGYDAGVQYWITTPCRSQYENTFHAEIKRWLEANWPYLNILFPGPELSDGQRGKINAQIARGTR